MNIFREESVITNLDKSILVFSKKHVILVHRNLSDFYNIRLRKPFEGEREKATITVHISTSDPNSVCVDPAQVTLSNACQQVTVRVSTLGPSALIDQDR